jgi:hypothetical protein
MVQREHGGKDPPITCHIVGLKLVLASEIDTRWTVNYLRLSCSVPGGGGGKKYRILGNLV